MKIQCCNLENFRNIESARLRFESDRIFFVGLNGQGKSNLLEGLGLLHALRSFRTSDLRHMIRRNSTSTRLFFEIETARSTHETALIQMKRAGGREVDLNGSRCASLGRRSRNRRRPDHPRVAQPAPAPHGPALRHLPQRILRSSPNIHSRDRRPKSAFKNRRVHSADPIPRPAPSRIRRATAPAPNRGNRDPRPPLQ